MQDKRVHPRVELEIEVSCLRKEGGAVGGVTNNVSMGGMFVQTGEILPFGTEITIELTLTGVALQLPGVVRWAKPGGFGVQFGLLGAKETHTIAKMLKG